MKHDTTKYKNKHLFLFIRILATSEWKTYMVTNSTSLQIATAVDSASQHHLFYVILGITVSDINVNRIANSIFQSTNLGNAHFDLHKQSLWCEMNLLQTAFKYVNRVFVGVSTSTLQEVNARESSNPQPSWHLDLTPLPLPLRVLNKCCWERESTEQINWSEDSEAKLCLIPDVIGLTWRDMAWRVVGAKHRTSLTTERTSRVCLSLRIYCVCTPLLDWQTVLLNSM